MSSGNISIGADSDKIMGVLPDEKGYYKISWAGDACGFNTYVARISDGLDFSEYREFMESLKLSGELSGF